MRSAADPARRLAPINPPEITILGASPLPKVLHQDHRGFLLETLRADDAQVNGARFQMSYSSFTAPGQFRDIDRWHVHHIQTDRFIVLLGEMTLALYDEREGSPTRGHLNLVRLRGAPPSTPTNPTPRDLSTFLVPIPPGVLHSLGNLSKEPFVYQNYPTEFYNPGDEGRVPFSALTIPRLGIPFRWDLVDPSPPTG